MTTEPHAQGRGVPGADEVPGAPPPPLLPTPSPATASWSPPPASQEHAKWTSAREENPPREDGPIRSCRDDGPAAS